jgi:hypothetical protein
VRYPMSYRTRKRYMKQISGSAISRFSIGWHPLGFSCPMTHPPRLRIQRKNYENGDGSCRREKSCKNMRGSPPFKTKVNNGRFPSETASVPFRKSMQENSRNVCPRSTGIVLRESESVHQNELSCRGLLMFRLKRKFGESILHSPHNFGEKRGLHRSQSRGSFTASLYTTIVSYRVCSSLSS